MEQHKTPCKDCPWRRSVAAGALGGSHPFTYVGQMELGYWLPCHSAYDPNVPPKLQNVRSTAQCAGAATFRSNAGIGQGVNGRANLRLPENKEDVFASYAEFVAHHMGIPLTEAEMVMRVTTPKEIAVMEHWRGLAQGTTRQHLIPVVE